MSYYDVRIFWADDKAEVPGGTVEGLLTIHLLAKNEEDAAKKAVGYLELHLPWHHAGVESVTYSDVQDSGKFIE